MVGASQPAAAQRLRDGRLRRRGRAATAAECQSRDCHGQYHSRLPSGDRDGVRNARHFSTHDDTAAPRVAIVNEAAVRRWFPGQNPIGGRVITNGVPREGVGVIADVLQRSAADPVAPTVFVPFAQRTIRSIKMVVRTMGDPAAVAPAIRAEIRALDADLAIADITPMTQLVVRSLTAPRFYTSLLALFAGVGLVLAAIGVFA